MAGAPLKISARVEIDANPAKQGAVTASSAVDSIGAAAERNTTKLQSLINATTGVGRATANQNTREWTGALAMQGRSIDELRAKYNPLFATITQYKAAIAEVRALHAQGVLSTNEMTAAIQRQRQATLASIDAIKGRSAAIRAATPASGNNFAATNAMFQFQDIGMTAAMGMDPRMIGLQQGTQLAGAFSGMSMRQAAGTMGTTFTQLLSPVSLLAVGLTTATAAGIQYFMAMGDGAEKTTADLEEQNDVIRRAAAYWGEATPALKAYVDELDRIKRASDGQEAGGIIASRELEKIGAELESLGGKAKSAVAALGVRPGTEATVQELGYAWRGLKDNIAAGTATASDFDRVKRALSDAVRRHDIPALADFQQSVDRVTSAFYRSFEGARKAREEWFKFMSGGANVQDILSGATFNDNGRIRQTDSFIPRDPPTPDRRPLVELEGLPGEEKRLDAQRERLRTLDQSIAAQRLELSLIGLTLSESTALRMEHQLTADLKAEALKTGLPVDQQELALIRKKSAAYGKLAEDIAGATMAQDRELTLQTLRVEHQLLGQSEEVRRRVLDALRTEQELKRQGIALDGEQAAKIRDLTTEETNRRLALEKSARALDKVRSTGESLIDNVINKIADGDFSLKAFLSDSAKDLSKLILEMSASTPLRTSL